MATDWLVSRTGFQVHLFSKVLLREASWQNVPAKLYGFGHFDECDVVQVGLGLVFMVGDNHVHLESVFIAVIHQHVKLP